MKKILKDLVSFNTINDLENDKIINYIENYLKRYGFKTEYKTRCLVMSNKNKCDIGFLGHTDTVTYSSNWISNPFELKEENDKLYGLGTCDMKGSIACIMSSISKIDFNKYKNGIKLFFTYDEEINFSGINELLNNKIEFPKYMIIGEPTNNEIYNSSKGLLEYKIIFKGKSAHSSKPNDGDNAIMKCISFINDINKYYKKINKDGTTMNIGIINGGVSVNIVPDYCELLIDFRTINNNDHNNIIEYIDKITNKYICEYEIINNIYPFINEINTNITDFITEASFIDSKDKIILGVGPVNPHKSNEYITINSLELLESQYINIIEDKLK